MLRRFATLVASMLNNFYQLHNSGKQKYLVEWIKIFWKLLQWYFCKLTVDYNRWSWIISQSWLKSGRAAVECIDFMSIILLGKLKDILPFLIRFWLSIGHLVSFNNFIYFIIKVFAEFRLFDSSCILLTFLLIRKLDILNIFNHKLLWWVCFKNQLKYICCHQHKWAKCDFHKIHDSCLSKM